MATYGWDDLRLKAGIIGGTWTNCEAYVDTQELAAHEANTEDYHPKGQASKSVTASGSAQYGGDFTLEGQHDPDTAAHPYTLIWGGGTNQGSIGKLAESYDATNYDIHTYIVISYEKIPVQGQTGRYKLTLRPYGTPLYDQSAPSGTVA